MKRLVVVLIVLFPYLARGADWSWDGADIARELVGAGVTVIDYGQTQDISNHGGEVELNPILGPHPSRAGVRNYFAGVLVLHPLISAALPKHIVLWGCELSPRLAWQYFYLGVEATATTSNFKGGLKFSF